MTPIKRHSIPVVDLAKFFLALAACCVVGALVPLTAQYSTGLTLILIASAAVPAFLLLIAQNFSAAVFLLLVSQTLEPFEVSLGFVSLSIGNIILFAIICIWGRAILSRVTSSRFLVAMTTVCGLFVASHLLQGLHTSVGSSLRGIVTVSSFFLFWLLGTYIGHESRDHQYVAYGAAAALCILGAIGALAAVGSIDTGVHQGGIQRDFFGFTSPLFRNYAFPGMQPVTVALLLSISLPFLSYYILSSRSLVIRSLAIFVYTSIFLLTILVFQSRSMLLELVAVWGILFAAQLRRWWVILPSAIGFGWLLYDTIQSLVSIDSISSDLRSDSYRMAISYVRQNPLTLVFGGPHDEIVNNITASSQFGKLIGYAPIHNMFLDQLIWGGSLAVITLALLFLVPLWVIVRNLYRSPIPPYTATISFGIASISLLEIMVNPVVANVAALWIGLGLVSGIAGSLQAPDRETVDSSSPERS